MKIRTADALLRSYVEAGSILASGRSPGRIACSGLAPTRCCTNRLCRGRPKRTVDGLKCSACDRLWALESSDLLPHEVQLTRRSAPEISATAVRIFEIGKILRAVQAGFPWPFAAWAAYVVGEPEPEDAGKRGLGLPLDLVPARLLRMRAAGELDLPFMPAITVERARWWIQVARREVTERIPIRGI